jgi:hypothetical protein
MGFVVWHVEHDLGGKCYRFLPGGGGKKGIPPLVGPRPLDDAPSSGLRRPSRPGILILNVWPSFNEKSFAGTTGLLGSSDALGFERCFAYDCRATLKSNLSQDEVRLTLLSVHEIMLMKLTHRFSPRTRARYKPSSHHPLQLAVQSTETNRARARPSCSKASSWSKRITPLR